MATSENSESLSDEELAKKIQNKLSNSPLIIDIVNEVKTHRQLGIPDEKIETILEQAFDVTSDEDYTSSRDEDKEIVVNNLPNEYNKLDWA